jgi:NADH-quinone oxidoreductase subunit E
MRDHVCSRLGVPLGATTEDGRFTLLPIVCLGACDHAPTMMIDGELHTDLDEPRIDAMLERYE